MLLLKMGATIPQIFLVTAILNAIVALYIFSVVPEYLVRFLAFSLATSLGWDLVRGLGNAALVLVFGGPVLRALHRATRRAAFAPQEG